MRSLATRTTLNTATFLAILAVVLFVSAGTLRFWQAWLFLTLNLVWLAVADTYFLRRDPDLVERRLIQDEQGEKEKVGVATPLVLGSYWAGLLLPPGWVLLIVRILAEERLLSERLSGYAEYMSRTRRRLIPGAW